MVRYLSVLVFLFFGCEINSKQIIKPEKFTYDAIKFNSVSPFYSLVSTGRREE